MLTISKNLIYIIIGLVTLTGGLIIYLLVFQTSPSFQVPENQNQPLDMELTNAEPVITEEDKSAQVQEKYEEIKDTPEYCEYLKENSSKGYAVCMQILAIENYDLDFCYQIDSTQDQSNCLNAFIDEIKSRQDYNKCFDLSEAVYQESCLSSYALTAADSCDKLDTDAHKQKCLEIKSQQQAIWDSMNNLTTTEEDTLNNEFIQ